MQRRMRFEERTRLEFITKSASAAGRVLTHTVSDTGALESGIGTVGETPYFGIPITLVTAGEMPTCTDD